MLSRVLTGDAAWLAYSGCNILINVAYQGIAHIKVGDILKLSLARGAVVGGNIAGENNVAWGLTKNEYFSGEQYCFIHVMRNEKHGFFRLLLMPKFDNHVLKICPRYRIQRAKRLVHKQYRRVYRECTRYGTRMSSPRQKNLHLF